jgi:hypothetical protein
MPNEFQLAKFSVKPVTPDSQHVPDPASFSAARFTDLNHLTGMRVGIRVFDVTGAVIKTEEHTGDVRES